MILRRMGNKKKLAPIIQKHMPAHDLYVEPFFGAGGMYFNKSLASHNILNDIDNDVYNLWHCYFYRKEELLEAVKITPYSMGIFKHFKTCKPKDEIEQALRFLYLSNFSLYGMMDTLHLGQCNSKNILINNFHTLHTNENVQFSNMDFRKFLNSIHYKKEDRELRVLIYCDPPYIGTGDNYSDSFTEQDTIDLLDILAEKEKKYNNFYYIVSEFKSDFILYQAGKRNLHVTEICERRNIKNRQTEIILTNYRTEKDTWF